MRFFKTVQIAIQIEIQLFEIKRVYTVVQIVGKKLCGAFDSIIYATVLLCIHNLFVHVPMSVDPVPEDGNARVDSRVFG